MRVLSALVMLPVAVAAVWLGGPAFVLLLSVLAALMYREWHAMCAGAGGGKPAASMLVGIAGCLAAPVLVYWTDIATVLLAGSGLAVLMASILLLEGQAHKAFRWTGFAYIWLSCAATAWFREIPGDGLATVIWLFGMVVATDTAAYFTGRTLGGPKLAPRISPKKTWSGLLGGVAGAAAVGAVLAGILGGLEIALVALVSGVFAVIAQIGDLVVSKAKRLFGVKDSGNLIPGHGGVLDRLDGFLAASLAMAVLSIVAGGSPLSWL